MVIVDIDEHLIVTSSLKICGFFCVCILGWLAECSVKHGAGAQSFITAALSAWKIALWRMLAIRMCNCASNYIYTLRIGCQEN